MTTHPVTVANDAIKLTAAQRRDALLAECALQRAQLGVQRSEERRVGKECPV